MASIEISRAEKPSCWERTKEKISKSFVGKVYRKIEPAFPLVSPAFNALANAFNARIFHVFLSIITNTTSATGQGWERYRGLWETMKVLKILAIFSIPFALIETIREIYHMIIGFQRCDSFLKTCENLSWLGNTTSSFIHGLSMTGNAGQAVVNVAIQLSVASGALSSAVLLYELKRYYHLQRFCAKISGKNDEEVLTLFSQLKDYSLNKYTGVENATKIREKINEILVKKDEKEMAAASEIIKTCLSNKSKTYRIAVVALLVIFTASILLYRDPTSIIAFAFLGAGSVMQVVRLLRDRRIQNNFEKDINAIGVSVS